MAARRSLCGCRRQDARLLLGGGSHPAKATKSTGQANDPGAMAGWPIAQARRSNHTAAAIASGLGSGTAERT